MGGVRENEEEGNAICTGRSGTASLMSGVTAEI